MEPSDASRLQGAIGFILVLAVATFALVSAWSGSLEVGLVTAASFLLAWVVGLGCLIVKMAVDDL